MLRDNVIQWLKLYHYLDEKEKSNSIMHKIKKLNMGGLKPSSEIAIFIENMEEELQLMILFTL